MRNFHLPLPDETYLNLRLEAERLGRPATVVAREAIEAWLKHCKRVARHEAIAQFAAEFGGTSLDLDPSLEAASLDHLGSGGFETK